MHSFANPVQNGVETFYDAFLSPDALHQQQLQLDSATNKLIAGANGLAAATIDLHLPSMRYYMPSFFTEGLAGVVEELNVGEIFHQQKSYNEPYIPHITGEVIPIDDLTYVTIYRYDKSRKKSIVYGNPKAGHGPNIENWPSPSSNWAKCALDNTEYSVFGIGHHPAKLQHRDYSLEDSVSALEDAIELILSAGPIQGLFGKCQRGWETALAIQGKDYEIENFFTIASPMNNFSDPNDLTTYINLIDLQAMEQIIQANGGVWPGIYSVKGMETMQWPKFKVEDPINLYNAVKDGSYKSTEQARNDFSSWWNLTMALPGKWLMEVAERHFIKNDIYEDRYQFRGKTVKMENTPGKTHAIVGLWDKITSIGQAVGVVEKNNDPNTILWFGDYEPEKAILYQKIPDRMKEKLKHGKDVTIRPEALAVENGINPYESNNHIHFLENGHLGTTMSRSALRKYYSKLFRNLEKFNQV